MSVGAHLDVGAPAAPSAHRHSTWLRRLAVAAVILIALLVVGLAVAPVRSAVADWLGIGSTHVVKVPGGVDTSGLPLIQERLRPVSRAEAEAVLRHPLPTVAALGDPQIVVLPPEGGVLMGWTEGNTTLWMHPIDIDPELVPPEAGRGGRERRTRRRSGRAPRSTSKARTSSRRPGAGSRRARCCSGCRTAWSTGSSPTSAATR